MSTSGGKRPPKRIAIGSRPLVNPQAEAWVREGDDSAVGKRDIYTARLTLDVTPALRARIKVSAFGRGITVAELLRAVLDREFPEQVEKTP